MQQQPENRISSVLTQHK